MHRLHLALFLSLLTLSPGLAAQVVADTTDPGSYFPYTVGSEWQYEATDALGEPFLERRVVAKAVREGRGSGFNFVLRITSRAKPGDPEWQEVRRDTVTYDAYHGFAVGYQSTANGGFRTYPLACAMASAFRDELDCWNGDRVVVDGGYARTVALAGGETVAVPALKAFRPVDTETPYATYASGIGQVSQNRLPTPERFTLAYARIVDGDGTVRTYGAEVAVARESPRPASRLHLRAFPSPTVGPVTVAVATPDPSGFDVEVFDTLGRRLVRQHVRDPQVGLDASTWAPGVYVVRVTAGGQTATTRIVRR